MELQELGVITPTGPHTTIAAAINAAKQSPGASVWIPAWYTGGDSVPATPGVATFDMRGTSGSFSGSPSSPNSSTIYAWDPKYGLKADTKYMSDATFVSGSNVVTTPSTDRPFTAADVGKICWGSNAMIGGNAQLSPTTIIPQGTITKFIDAHTVTVSVNALFSCTPTFSDGCVFAWGSDDTAALQSAFADATNVCGTLVLPAGGMIVQAPIQNLSTLCQSGVASNDAPIGITVIGQGPYQTMLFFTPSYTFAGVMFQTQNLSCRRYYYNFGVASFVAAPPAANGQTGFAMFFNSEIHTVWFTQFFPSNANAFTALALSGALNAVTSAHNLLMINSGFKAVSVTNSDVNLYDNWIQGSSTCLETNSLVRFKSWGNRITLCGTLGAAHANSGSTDWSSWDDVFNAVGTTLPVVNLAGSAGTSIRFHNVTIGGSQTTGASLGISANNSVTIDGEFSVISTSTGTAAGVSNAGTLSLRNTQISSSGGTGLINSGTLTVKDSNTFLNSITNTGVIQGQPGQGILQGSCTGVGTASSTLGLYGLGQFATPACTSTVVNLGQVMAKAGTAYALYATATAAGTNASSGVVTVLKNNVPQTLTCTIGTGTSCSDGASAHTFTYVAGDVISVQFTTQAADTLAGVKGFVVTQ